MGLLRRAKQEKTHDALETLLIEDPALTHRIEEVRSGRHSTNRHPDACQNCGNIDPGFRHCRRCGQEVKREARYGCFWFQDVSDTLMYQEAFEKLLEGAERGADGAVWELVTVALLPERSHARSEETVRVMATRGKGPAHHVGYIPSNIAPFIHETCLKVQDAHRLVLACDGLVEGGSHLDDGRRAPYEIRLILPLPHHLMNQVNAAAWR